MISIIFPRPNLKIFLRMEALSRLTIDHKYWLSKDQIEALPDGEKIEFYNAWSDYWRYDIGINVLPAGWVSRDKELKFIPFENWGKWQNEPIPEEMHNQWKSKGSFTTGIAGVLGCVFHRPDRVGYYFGQVDLDNALAIKEVLHYKGDNSLADFARRTPVVQHADNLENSAHIKLYSKTPLVNKPADVSKSDTTLPAFEVHCIGRIGIMPGSKHRKGYPMMFLDGPETTIEPMTQENREFEDYLDSIHIKYGMGSYLNGDNGSSNHKDSDSSNYNYEGRDSTQISPEILEMIKGFKYNKNVKIDNGKRHKTLVKIADSILFRYLETHDIDELKDFFVLLNEHCCKPPTGIEERDEIWDDAVDYVTKEQAKASSRILSVSGAIKEKPGRNKTVRGTVVSISTPFKVAKRLCYRCLECDVINEALSKQPGVDFVVYPLLGNSEPKKCVNCSESKFAIDYENSEFDDAKIITLQNTDLSQQASLDETLEIILLGDDTDGMRAGEVMTARGIIYYAHSNIGPPSKGKKMIALMYVKEVSYEDRQNFDITKTDIQTFHKFANYYPNTIQRLASMFAPNVVGEQDHKLGVLRSIVGGVDEQRRGRIHSLFVGQQGLAKSLVMREATKAVPNSRYITAMSASSKSALGIVDVTGDVKTLLFGPIPLASGSIVGIDELQSWTHDEQGILLNVMEEGVFYLLKYARDKPIVAQTTILSTVNPQDIKYENRDSIGINEINILTPLLDRFDQVYVVLDDIDEQKDRSYATQRLRFTRHRRPHNYNFLTKYLLYAKTIQPTLTPESTAMLIEFWIELRKQKLAGKRMLEVIFRIAEAMAKLQLRYVIDASIATSVMESVKSMQVKLGRYVRTIEDPRNVAVTSVCEVIENTQSLIAFDEAMKVVCKENQQVRSWLMGGGSSQGSTKVLNSEGNKRYREIRDRFLIQIQAPESNIFIKSMKPLVVVWQTAKTPDITNDKVNDKNDNKHDNPDNLSDQLTYLTREKSDENKIKITENTSENRSVRHEIGNITIETDKPTYEYLKHANAYRCNWCKVVYHDDTKDTNVGHPCNSRGGRESI